MSYSIVVYDMTEQEPRSELLVAKRGTKAECQNVMRHFAGKGWEMERRPDVHAYGNLVLTFKRDA